MRAPGAALRHNPRMVRPLSIVLLVVALLGAAAPSVVRAQDGAAAGAEAAAGQETDAARSVEAQARGTGDPVVDARIADIDRYAARHPEAFVDELVRYFDAPRALVKDLLEQGRAPGDVYYACALARVTGRPCRGVVEARAARAGEDWEALARSLGVVPGDVRARRLREGMAESYARWARPLPDAD